MNTLNVSTVQHFSTGDGPGIRTTVFLKGCEQRCPWCHNPENISSEPVTIRYNNVGSSTTYGRLMTYGEILTEVSEDKEFYLASGGGVTFSGGEPLLQSKSLAGLEEILRDDGITTLVDTAGCVPWEAFSDVIDHTDMFYFDYKTADARYYRTVINGDKELVLDNLKRLIDAGKAVHVRVPLIPGVNTDTHECEKMCDDLSLIGVKYVDLLPFHRLGSSKYTHMGIEYPFGNVLPPDSDQIHKCKAVFDKRFITTVE